MGILRDCRALICFGSRVVVEAPAPAVVVGGGETEGDLVGEVATAAAMAEEEGKRRLRRKKKKKKKSNNGGSAAIFWTKEEVVGKRGDGNERKWK